MLYLAATIFIIALALLWQARQRQRHIGLPAGRVIYADTRDWEPVEQALYDPDLGLTGRPDYLVKQGDRVIPVEVKSSRVSAAPYDAHIYQLAAYCLLVERGFGERPSHGILHYPSRTFSIDYTHEMETAFLDLLDQMRAMDRRREVRRSHQSETRCRSCGFRSICDQQII